MNLKNVCSTASYIRTKVYIEDYNTCNHINYMKYNHIRISKEMNNKDFDLQFIIL